MSPSKTKRTVTADRARFAKLLIGARNVRGYTTAYAFFYGNGGAKVFGISYHHYAAIEKGTRLPSAERFKTILDVLGSKYFLYISWHKLVEAYMKAVVGGGTYFDDLFATPNDPAPARESIESKLLKKSGGEQIRGVPRMTVEQESASQIDPETYWVYTFLARTGQRVTLAQLAAALSLPDAKVASALEGLLRAKLIVRQKDAYHSDDFKTGRYTPSSATTDNMIWTMNQYTKRLDGSTDDPMYLHHIFALEDKERIRDILILIRDYFRKCFFLKTTTPVTKGNLVGSETRLGTIIKTQ